MSTQTLIENDIKIPFDLGEENKKQKTKNMNNQHSLLILAEKKISKQMLIDEFSKLTLDQLNLNINAFAKTK